MYESVLPNKIEEKWPTDVDDDARFPLAALTLRLAPAYFNAFIS